MFRFADPFNRRYRRVDLELPTELDPWAVLDGSATPIAPVPASLAAPGDLDAVLWTTEAVLGLVCDRFAGWLEDAGVTGWSLFQVAFSDEWTGSSDYHGLVVTGRSAPVDYWRNPEATERDDWRIRLRPSEWDGSDLFLAQGTAYIFATEKVYRLVSQHQIKNVEMKNVADVRVAHRIVRNPNRGQ